MKTMAAVMTNQIPTLERLLERIAIKPPKPFYLQIIPRADGSFEFRQIEFLSVKEAAELVHVNERTVYGWIADAEQNGLKFYKAPGARNVLFDLGEYLDWVKGAGPHQQI
jgi:excisionase family DNA binding protein